MGIPLVRGRNFLPEELAGKNPATIINETMARTLWGDRNPIGWKVNMGVLYTVIGVARDVRQSGLGAPVRSEMYMALPTLPEPITEQSIVVRSTLPLERMMPSIRRIVRNIDPGAALFRVETMQDVLEDSVSYTRILATLLFLFAILALLIAAFGLHGVMSYIVSERTREFAIRMAVGAKPAQLIGMVFGQSAIMLSAGVALAVCGVLLVSRLLPSLLYGVRAVDIPSLILSVVVLGAAALLGLAIPAFRATRVDPIFALREE